MKNQVQQILGSISPVSISTIRVPPMTVFMVTRGVPTGCTNLADNDGIFAKRVAL